MHFLPNDLIELISQYSPKVYCLLRLLNHHIYEIINNVLPCGLSIRQKRDFLSGIMMEHCGFKLLDRKDSFSAWIVAMKMVFQRENERHCEIAEKYCRDYCDPGKPLQRNALQLLCHCRARGFVWELFWKNRVGLECGGIAMLGDLDFFVEVYSNMEVISKELVKDWFRCATQYQHWKITEFLWKEYSMDDEILRYGHGLFFDAVKKRRLKDLDPLLRKDQEVMLEAVKRDCYSLAFIDESLVKDRAFILQALKLSWGALPYVHESFLRDKEIVLEAFKVDPYALSNADPLLFQDKEFIADVLDVDGYGIYYADESIKKDKEMVYRALKQNGYSLKYVYKSFRKDKDAVRVAVKGIGFALEFADESLKKDYEIVMEAVKQDGRALQFADESLKRDYEIVRKAMKNPDDQTRLLLQ